MTSMKIVQFLSPPHLSCPSTSYILPPTRHWTSNFKRTPLPPSPYDKQSIKRKYNPRMTIICYQVLPSGQLSFSESSH